MYKLPEQTMQIMSVCFQSQYHLIGIVLACSALPRREGLTEPYDSAILPYLRAARRHGVGHGDDFRNQTLLSGPELLDGRIAGG
jgi:hypothetical protein